MKKQMKNLESLKKDLFKNKGIKNSYVVGGQVQPTGVVADVPADPSF